MADRFSPEKRSWVMSRVRSRDTVPERLVRSFLHRRGFRFRLHVSALPGTPDIVLPKYRTVVFVNGCFWHGHARCRRAALPKTRTAFWRKKIALNVSRDRAAIKRLATAGWRVLVVWTCQIDDGKSLEKLLRPVLRAR